MENAQIHCACTVSLSQDWTSRRTCTQCPLSMNLLINLDQQSSLVTGKCLRINQTQHSFHYWDYFSLMSSHLGSREHKLHFNELWTVFFEERNNLKQPTMMHDVVIYSTNRKDHLAHVCSIFRRVRGAGLTVQLSKCQFGKNRCVYLVHSVRSGDAHV